MNKTSILIVEDELLIAENLATKLKKLEYEVTKIVSSGQAAIKEVNVRSPDLILMDIAIKGSIDGVETARIIRQTLDIPIIFLTAYADDKTLDRASETGCHGYILKPFKDRELHAAIKITLNKHREQNTIKSSLQAKVDQYAAKFSPRNIDSLTRLPNHLCLQSLFNFILSTSENEVEGQSVPVDWQAGLTKKNVDLVAVLYFKIDRFNRIFNSLSDEGRNLLILTIADCLTDSLAEYEGTNATIKLQDSEFVILVAGLKQHQEAKNIAEQIIRQFRKSFIIENLEIFLTASIGIAFYPIDNVDLKQLLKQAYLGLEYAQKQGGNQCRIYTTSLQLITKIAQNNLSIEAELHHALERQELELYYQPKVALTTGKIVGAEALIRWNHPVLGLMMPSQFISIAEQSSLIESIGEWVLTTACKKTRTWRTSGYDDFSIAVNISGRQFKQLDLFHRLSQILFESKLKPSFLELELTEKILVENEKINIQRLNLIKKLNIQISLDDFGTGYSSLGYLQQFSFNILKIDCCFINQVDHNSKNAVITKSIIEMAHQLGLKVVAEGVETQSELEFLLAHQCDQVQGFLFSRPLPVKEFEQLLCSHRSFDLHSPKLQTTER